MRECVFTTEEQEVAKGKVILLVDDSEDDAELTIRSLSKAHILNEVVWMKGGQEALDYLFGDCLGKGHPLPQIVLLDIHMPRVNGIDVLQRIRGDERTKRLPVVIFSSSREERDLVESHRLGVNSYVCKPVNFAEFTTTVSALGCYWLLMNQFPNGPV